MVRRLYVRTLIKNFLVNSFLVTICCCLPAHMLSNLADTQHTYSCEVLLMYITDKVGPRCRKRDFTVLFVLTLYYFLTIFGSY